MDRHRIKDLPQHERPRERLETQGPTALSNPELIAIILRTGNSSQTAVELASTLLSRHGSLRELSKASVAEISKTKGIGAAKACQIAAAFELGRRSAGHLDSMRPKITCPADLADLVRGRVADSTQELLMAALLNAKNELMRVVTITQGTLTASLIHPRETFRAAIAESCYALILIHNHPSGDPEPSGEDVSMTRKMVEAGAILGIKVLDHIIIGGDSFTSMKDKGIIT